MVKDTQMKIVLGLALLVLLYVGFQFMNKKKSRSGMSSPSSNYIPSPSMHGPAYATTDATTSGKAMHKVPSNHPGDLLPKDMNTSWGNINPQGEGELQSINLLQAADLIGINTVGSSLRNANLQLRSEPPNPKVNTGPWLQSTIEPDLMRVPLEIGSGSQ